MPTFFSQQPFLAVCDDERDVSENKIGCLSRCAPIVVPYDNYDTLLPKLAGSEYWVLLATQDHNKKHTIDDVVKVFDNGAAKVITNDVSVLEYVEDSSRIVYYIDSSKELESGNNHKEFTDVLHGVAAVYVAEHVPTDVDSLSNIRAFFGSKSKEAIPIFICPNANNDASKSLDLLAQLNAANSSINAKLWLSTKKISFQEQSTSASHDRVSISALFLAALHTDRPDRLFSTIVSSSSPNISLGLVYSNAESISASLLTGCATYYSRSRKSLWRKGETSGATQTVVRLRIDCDGDALEFSVMQKPNTSFCHTEKAVSCFGPLGGVAKLLDTLGKRLTDAPPQSYTRKLFNDADLLAAKIREEADEVCRAETREEIAAEVADLLYFTFARCVTSGVSLSDVEAVLDGRSSKITRRPGLAKPAFIKSTEIAKAESQPTNQVASDKIISDFTLPTYKAIDLTQSERIRVLKRPHMASNDMTAKVQPIISAVQKDGDKALRGFVSKFDRCAQADQAEWPLVMNAPFPKELMILDDETKAAIDRAYANIHLFHHKQMEREEMPLSVETMPGVVCSRFSRAIERVGCYVPGGTAILPSTALMLAVPASIAKCKSISIVTPPSPVDGSIRPEIVYIANKCGVSQIVKAGGAHAVASLAYGTESINKVDKIVGPGNQWVTAAKMVVSMDSSACVSIEMPAGPSEVLVVADSTANPAYVASDLLSQAEHGTDSQVVLLGVKLSDADVESIVFEIKHQANKLPRSEIVRECLSKSVIIRCESLDDAMQYSNEYAPEHLILHITEESGQLDRAFAAVQNAGSVFLGPYSPESCGDYASGTNHTLPTYGYARQYSGVSTSTFLKHITAQKLTKDGIGALGPSVVQLAEIEGLQAHANAVTLRLLSK